MRPNYCMDAPPTSIEVGGFAYPCETDFRVWLGVLHLLKQIDLRIETDEDLARLTGQMMDIQEMVFGGVLEDENPVEVLRAISEFSKGYPSAPMSSAGTSDAPTFSFEYDLNEIIIAIRNQSGIDLSYRRKEPFHWWEFLLEFHTLCGSHYILNLMETRGYKGKDKEMLRRKYACALPNEYTAKEQAENEAFLAMFDAHEEAEEEEDNE